MAQAAGNAQAEDQMTRTRSLGHNNPLEAALPPPFIVLHMGGAGSRLLSDILEDAGVFMGGTALAGPWRELPLFYRDAAAFVDNFRYSPPWPRDWRTAVMLHRERVSSLLGERLLPVLREGGYQQGSWGFKDPRSVFLASIYAELWPRARAIHLVRDGRDVTASKLEKGRLERQSRNSASDWMNVWGAHQQEIRNAIDRHRWTSITIRYEDLCLNSERVAVQLADFLPARLDSLVSSIRSRSHARRIGFWRAELDPQAWSPFTSTLNQFGYRD